MIKKVICMFFVAVLVIAGCTKVEKHPIPEKNLTPDQEGKILGLLDGIKPPPGGKKLVDWGESAVPVILERIFELNEKVINERGKYTKEELATMSSDLSKLIRYLGRIKSKKAVPSLVYMLKEERRFRLERPDIASALGRIGDKSAVEPLKEIFKEELEYLEAGDHRGPLPPPPPGYKYAAAAGFTCKCIGETGKALYELGEIQVVGDLIDALIPLLEKHKQGKWYGFYDSITSVLIDIIGEEQPEVIVTADIESTRFWSEWWEKNKDRFGEGQ